ncbi:hypothetical protein [Lysobacter enzymogenes]|uniref:hypothetical protein n=1 Tax=Lysobacter enzymogenes TaxID=69 RepID=UPI001116A128|nr:hypothetical protein [Lysobacter enzymogenes]UZW62777.1 hypothetical protein BV903_010985 [Lysobacter enzymogenes]
MITLNTEKGLVRIDNWEDIESRPGFTPIIDPKTIKLKEIIGRYHFPFDIPCGLSNCRTPHQRGLLVVATDGREVNIGRHCGKREFGTDFHFLSRAFVAAERAQRYRETLGELKNRLPSIAAEISVIRHGPHGAGWINTRVRQLNGKSVSLPTPFVNAVRQAIRRGDGVLTIQRAATKAERDAQEAASSVPGSERRQRIHSFVEDSVGQLEGFSALFPNNDLREILASIEPLISEVSEVDIDSLPDKRLRELSKANSELEPNLERLRATIAAGRRLLVRSNIEQLARFATSRAEEKLLDQFLHDLPDFQ